MTVGGAPHRVPTAPSRETSRLAVLLAWVAGGVDAVGYLTLAHVFTAHMSGNSVGLGTGLGQADWSTVLERGAPVALFCIGIVVGTVVGTVSDGRGARHPAVPVFAVEVALLAAFWALGHSLLREGALTPSAGWSFYGLVALLTLAMGLQSATLNRVGSHGVHTTFVSGILTSLGEAVGDALYRRRGPATVRGDGDSPGPRIRLYGSVWGSYLVGATLATALLGPVGLTALALPIAGLLVAIVQDLRHPHELARLGHD